MIVSMKPFPIFVKPYEPGTEVAQIARLLARAIPEEAVDEARWVRQVLLDPNFDPACCLLAWDPSQTSPDAEPVGLAFGVVRRLPLENAPPDFDRGYLNLLGVAPEFRRRGVASLLLAELEKAFFALGARTAQVSGYAPGYFAPGVEVHRQAPALQFLSRRGYREVYRPLAMEVSLWNFSIPDDVAALELRLRQESVELTAYEPSLTLPVLTFAKDEFQGDWVRFVREAMRDIVSGADPRRLIVARSRDSGRVLGFSHYGGERFGPIGVAADQRGRGIGLALMHRTLEAQRLAGYRASWFLWSDDPTAAKIYDRAGFREVRRYALMRKDLVGGLQ